MSTHTRPRTELRPVAPQSRELTDLLVDLEALRTDPHASDLDWLIWHEAKAALLSRIAEASGSRAVAEAAEEAWSELDKRCTRLHLDPHDLNPAAIDAAAARTAVTR